MRPRERPPRTVTASEIAKPGLLPRGVWLAALGLPFENDQERTDGTRHRAHEPVVEEIAGGSIALGRLFLSPRWRWALCGASADDSMADRYRSIGHRPRHRTIPSRWP